MLCVDHSVMRWAQWGQLSVSAMGQIAIVKKIRHSLGRGEEMLIYSLTNQEWMEPPLGGSFPPSRGSQQRKWSQTGWDWSDHRRNNLISSQKDWVASIAHLCERKECTHNAMSVKASSEVSIFSPSATVCVSCSVQWKQWPGLVALHLTGSSEPEGVKKCSTALLAMVLSNGKACEARFQWILIHLFTREYFSATFYITILHLLWPAAQ